jgi:hypothetical protein
VSLTTASVELKGKQEIDTKQRFAYREFMMKRMSVLLAGTTYEVLTRQATLEAVEPSQYCSMILTEFADKHRHLTNAEPIVNSVDTGQTTLPDTVSQVLAVTKYVWVDGLAFNDAINRTAEEFSVRSTTVRDKCTRRISLPGHPVDTQRFQSLLSKPASLRDHFCQKFPKHKAEIVRSFNDLISTSMVTPNCHSIGSNTIKPATEVNERQLINAIITALRENKGGAAKSVVEDAVFQKFKDEFDDPYYRKMVGAQVGFPGVPRWRKNVEFARNTARQMGLIKHPEESGRGIWALTEIGENWGEQ